MTQFIMHDGPMFLTYWLKANTYRYQDITSITISFHTNCFLLKYTDIVLRSQGTRFTLSRCKYELYKHSFINRCLFNDVY